ncbi:unnamed protein product [Phyllotreta striolata]|uniref:Gamma-tubulin complex component n=1 Tax=Phyllotreta striolata TaxID=444603 RepID=A0A9N9TR22_PHYSR|nr:unnamed protein product [Phyllotreta striolata]
MIHECLFMLFNTPSEENLLESENWARLCELKEFLHPGEKKLLETIAEIAKDYHQINIFNKKVLNQTLNFEAVTDTSSVSQKLDTEDQQFGSYITAFCSGVHNVLDAYRTEVIELEGIFLQNPQLSLTFILCKLEKYRILFQALLSMINTIRNESIKGCLIIGRLHKYAICGVDQISKSAYTIVKSINTVFYKHLGNWIINGDLIDTYDEFFIKDGKCADENFLYPEQLLEMSNESLTSSQKRKIRRPPIVQNFYINWDMVPSFMSEDLVETILFMGRIVWIIRNDPSKCKEENYQVENKREIWEGKDNKYYMKIQTLESKAFNNIAFQKTIEECKVKLTKYLWSIMLDEGNLISHLHLIRDYYLLGRGELFQQFIRVAKEHLNDPSSELLVENLNFIFLEIARKIYSDNDKTYLKFELSSITEMNNCKDPWSKLQLNLDMDWPLHIVFHPKVIELYNKLFCYLLRLRKTQIDLHKLWADQVSSKREINIRVGTLRQNLMFLVSNLYYYLQVDVIEAQFSLLMKAVENANGLEDIIKVHHEFISNVLAKTFVSTFDEAYACNKTQKLYQMPAVHCEEPSQVYIVIFELLELCDKFCFYANAWGSLVIAEQLEQLEVLEDRCNLIIKSLLMLLQKLHEKASGQHVLQLLSQLDFNRYFSKQKSNISCIE